MTTQFTQESLPEAVRWLFESNGYSVIGPIHRHGSEIDLIATQLGGLGKQEVYIEVTVQYVDTAKYGKDLTKLVMINEPSAQKLIVSAKGFTAEVRERSAQIGVKTYTYDELVRAFEKTEPYINAVLGDGEMAQGLARLHEVYEQPRFVDRYGDDVAPTYLTDWLLADAVTHPWLVVVGEYGTGKTALTRVLQRRWTELYRGGGHAPLPFRIELRDFTKQFDSRGLLHHFLDRNELSHVPVAFVESMIATGRVVLLLDGYDEMAQYLNVRERRACLEALADLASHGARGILTSRPNYFSEAEELRVFEVLYQQLSARSMPTDDLELLEEERRVDDILERFLLERRERELKDLSPAQTESLVRRQLEDDPVGAELVIGLLRQVFRTSIEDTAVSLSGKPVIVTYLLEVVSELKEQAAADATMKNRSILSEWQIFDIIVNNLMRRDYRRTPQLYPTERREFLEEMALELARTQQTSLAEVPFRSLVKRCFDSLIQRRIHEGVIDFADSLVDDLRSSATLTRSGEGRGYVWQFSHNSLREFLLTGRLLKSLSAGTQIDSKIVLSDAMKLFARALPEELMSAAVSRLASAWPGRRETQGLDQLLCLIWLGLLDHNRLDPRSALASVCGSGLDMSGVRLSGLSFGDESGHRVDLSGMAASDSELAEVDFVNTDLVGANFSGTVFDSCSLRNVDLRNAILDGVFMLDCDLTSARLADASARKFDPDSTVLRVVDGEPQTLSGQPLIGYLRYMGADTVDVDAYFVFQHAPDFDIVPKVLKNLADGNWSQRRGLENRGVSQKNVRLAKRFVAHLLSAHLIEEKGGAPGLVRPTPEGRATISRFLDGQETDSRLAEFLHLEFHRRSE
ncbi:NACHT domain-containing protein [Kribbella sp. CA-247076]|uniref:NACHT domain-containing protein n=1 Tax=Kribbella sp. CA-247076 TaxID=3239941 RepID=UPI003D9227E4